MIVIDHCLSFDVQPLVVSVHTALLPRLMSIAGVLKDLKERGEELKEDSTMIGQNGAD